MKTRIWKISNVEQVINVKKSFRLKSRRIGTRFGLPIEQAQIDGSGGGFLGEILSGAGIGAKDLTKKLE